MKTRCLKHVEDKNIELKHLPFKDEDQTALFKAPVRTAL